MTSYIRVINWEKFQHYKDRSPPWIKLHHEILSSRTWVTGDDASRALAIAIMLLAARTDNKIPADTNYLKRVAYLNGEPDFAHLIETEFVEIIDEDGAVLADASKNLADASAAQANATQRRGEKRRGRSASQGKRATSLPADFSITDDMREWARKELPQLNGALEAETGKFCDHHAAKGSAFKDWRRAWQKWMRNAAEYRRTDGIKADESHLPEHLRGFVC